MSPDWAGVLILIPTQPTAATIGNGVPDKGGSTSKIWAESLLNLTQNPDLETRMPHPTAAASSSGPSPPEDLIINLCCADGDVVLPVRRLLLHLREEQLQGPLINAWVLGGSLMAEGKAQWPHRRSHNIGHPVPSGTLT